MEERITYGRRKGLGWEIEIKWVFGFWLVGCLSFCFQLYIVTICSLYASILYMLHFYSKFSIS